MSKKKRSTAKRSNKPSVNNSNRRNEVQKPGSIHSIIISIRDILIGMYASEFFAQPFHDFHVWLLHLIKAMFLWIVSL